MMKPAVGLQTGSHLKTKIAVSPRPIPAPRGVMTRVAEAERAAPVQAKTIAPAHPDVKELVLNKLKYQFGEIGAASPRDAYQGAAWSVREALIDAFDKTHAHWK